MATYTIAAHEGTCPFNKMVDCKEGSCAACGWNPTVASQRIVDWHMKRKSKKMMVIG